MSTFLGDFIEYEILLKNGQTIQLNEYTKDALTIKPDGTDVKVMMDTGSIIIYNQEGEVLN